MMLDENRTLNKVYEHFSRVHLACDHSQYFTLDHMFPTSLVVHNA